MVQEVPVALQRKVQVLNNLYKVERIFRKTSWHWVYSAHSQVCPASCDAELRNHTMLSHVHEQ